MYTLFYVTFWTIHETVCIISDISDQVTSYKQLKITMLTKVICTVTKLGEKVQFSKETVKQPANQPANLH